jgi:hypothetical protein
MCDPSVPSYFDPDDPNLDPEKALCLEMALDAHMLWPEDAEELIKLTNDTPTLEELGDPYYFDKLREKVNRLGLKPNDGHDLEDMLGDF